MSIEFEGFYDKKSLRKKTALVEHPSTKFLLRRLATSGWIIQTGNQGAARDCDQVRVSTAVYGFCVCHLQYTPLASLFLWGKRTFSFSNGAADGWESARGLVSVKAAKASR